MAFIKKIEAMTPDVFNALVARAFKKRPPIIVGGGNARRRPAMRPTEST